MNSHRSLITLLTLMVAFCGVVGAQYRDNSRTKEASSGTGVKAVLCKAPIAVSSDGQESFKVCLREHPRLACVPLKVSVVNGGTETLLLWTTSCGGIGVQFDIRNSDGVWQKFPLDWSDRIVCSRNVLMVQSMAPGEHYDKYLTLADPELQLDTALPRLPDHVGEVGVTRKGYLLLSEPGVHTFRARLNFHGCLTKEQTSADAIKKLGPFEAMSLCSSPNKFQEEFLQLQSNEVDLESSPTDKEAN